MIEMLVTRTERQRMLHGKRGDPDVVRRNRRPLCAELRIDVRVTLRRHVIGVKDLDALIL